MVSALFDFNNDMSLCTTVVSLFLLALHCYNKMHQIINLKRGKVDFGSRVWRYYTMVRGPWAFGPVGGNT